MIVTIGTFRERVQHDMNNLVADLRRHTGRYGEEEAKSWRASLPKLAHALQGEALRDLHLYFGSRGNLALEYQLPAAPSWCDVVLLGEHESRPSAVIIELKNWTTRGDQAGVAEGLITRSGRQEMHPSDQVRGYVNFCQRYHSTVHEQSAQVHGCVLFTNDFYKDAYETGPNGALVHDYPIFTTALDDVGSRLPAFFRTRLTRPNEHFATAFERGTYRQDRGFMRQIGDQILDPKQSYFELLDDQRRAFALCDFEAKCCREALQRGQLSKRVLIVKGPPGSGKSAVAARLWASIVTDEDWPEGNVLMVTTSRSQNSNWSYLFNKASDEVAAGGAIRKATVFTPLTTSQVGTLRKKHGKSFLKGVGTWREHLHTLRLFGVEPRHGARDNENLVSIVDEAHALINPENPGGVGQFGFATNLGPQGYHIIRASVLTVFFLDPEQGFRNRENTTIEEISAWAEELGAGKPQVISLEGVQFRCAGSVQYVTWVESLLASNPVEKNRLLATAWNVPADPLSTGQSDQPDNVIAFPTELSNAAGVMAAESAAPYLSAIRPQRRFDFQFFETPEEMENALRARIAEGNTARIFASDCREWKTAKAARPHELPPSMQDFHESYQLNGVTKYWSRPWNVLLKKGEDYSRYVAGAPGGKIHQDPLAEVGCPYTVRGFDYDYVGLLWLNDLMWRDEWQVDVTTVYDKGLRELVRAARRTPAAESQLLRSVAKAYRILLTRPLKGLYLWVPDARTRAYIQASATS